MLNAPVIFKFCSLFFTCSNFYCIYGDFNWICVFIDTKPIV